MKLLCLILFFPLFAEAQTALFYKQIAALKMEQDSLFEVAERKPGKAEVSYESLDLSDFESLLMAHLQSFSTNKSPIRQSVFLTRLSLICTEAWKGSVYGNSERWGKLQKHLNRSMREYKLNFGIVSSISFRIPLLNSRGKDYYYDHKIGTSEHNLYLGQKPKVSKDKTFEEIQAEAIPLKYFTEEELMEQVLRKIRSKRQIRDLQNGVYSSLGISIQVDQNSLNKSKIPTARVVILFGARRLKLLKQKKQP